MISTLSSVTSASVAVRRKKLRTPAKKSRTSCSSNAFSKDSIGREWVTLAKPAAGAVPTRRVGLSARGGLRKPGFDLVVAAAQRVVIGVGNLGCCIGVVKPVVALDLLRQRSELRPSLVLG